MYEVLGVDVSLWNTDSAYSATRWFDPKIAKEKGVKFAFIKASEGKTKDPQVDKFAQLFADAGIPYGFYHFARPDPSYIIQADTFWNIIKNLGWSLPPVLDLERSGVGLSFTKAFLGRIGSKANVKPILYTSPGFWTSLSGYIEANWVKNYPLWVANYKHLPLPLRNIPKDLGTPFIPPPFTNWTFWQFSPNGDGEYFGGNYNPRYENKVPVDLNVYNGSLEEMYAEFNIGQEPTPQPPPNEDEFVRVVNCQWLSFRSRPEVYPGDRPAIGAGVKAKVLDRSDGWLYVELSGGDRGWVSEKYTQKE